MTDSLLSYRKYLHNLLLGSPVGAEAAYSYAGYINRPVHEMHMETMNHLLTLSSYNTLIGSQSIPQRTINPFMYHAGEAIPSLQVRGLPSRDQSQQNSHPSSSILRGNHDLANSTHLRVYCGKNQTTKAFTDPLQKSALDMKYHRNGRQPRTIDWEDRLQMLIDFKKEHGHCMVPQNHPNLGAWVKWQREKYALYENGKTSYFTPEKIERLNKLGFVWRVRRKRRKNESRSDTDSAGSCDKREVEHESPLRKSKKQRIKN